MKIYIIEYKPSLFKQNMDKMKNLLVSTVQHSEIYSELYGLQIIKDNCVYQLESKFKTEMEIKKHNNIIYKTGDQKWVKK